MKRRLMIAVCIALGFTMLITLCVMFPLFHALVVAVCLGTAIWLIAGVVADAE